jgi:hypothetical protein
MAKPLQIYATMHLRARPHFGETLNRAGISAVGGGCLKSSGAEAFAKFFGTRPHAEPAG